jgi:hypothetical protein
MQTISKHRPIHARKERTRRRSGSEGRAVAPDTTAATATDFLRHSFLPLCASTNKALPDQESTEASYFKSLLKLKGLHQIEPLSVADKPFPYNILLSHWDAQRKIHTQNEDMDVEIISDNGKVLLSTTDSINADHKLFYLPVKPLYLLSKVKGIEDKKATKVLYSVFAYLYRHVGVPYYRSDESYQYWHYEMIETWITEAGYDEDAEATQDHLEEINAAKHYGDFIESRIYSLDNLRYFGARLQSLNPVTDWQKRCAAVAQDFYDLYTHFSEASVFKHMQRGHNPYFDEIDEEDCIEPHQYLGFVAATGGWLGETLFEMVSNELNECVTIDLPSITHVYDEHLSGLDENISYERKLFELIGELSNLLNELL